MRQNSILIQQVEIERTKQNMKLLVMLIFINVSFIIFTLPYSTFNNENFKIHYEISFIANMISYSNKSFNSIFYIIFLVDYRKTIKEIIRLIISIKNYRFKCKNKLNRSEMNENNQLNNDDPQNSITNIEINRNMNDDFAERINQFEFIDA